MLKTYLTSGYEVFALDASRTKCAVEKATMRVDGEKSFGMGAHHPRSLMPAFCAGFGSGLGKKRQGLFQATVTEGNRVVAGGYVQCRSRDISMSLHTRRRFSSPPESVFRIQ